MLIQLRELAPDENIQVTKDLYVAKTGSTGNPPLACSHLPSVVLPPVCLSPVSQVKQVFHMFVYRILT